MKNNMKTRVISFMLSALLMLTGWVGTAGSKAYAAYTGPELLITEILPMSHSSDDAYEFIELYNNSDSSIDIKNYKLPYQNVDITDSKVIPSKGVLVIGTKSSTTLSSFNDFYDTSITQDRYTTLPLVDEMLDDDSNDSILIARDDGTVVVRAKYDSNDFDVKKSITYKYPKSGFDMSKLGERKTPTPGSVSSEQIPYGGTRVTGVTLNKSVITMEAGQTATLYATVSPSTATNKSVTWSSDDKDIVEVSNNGVLTAKSEGVAEVTVKTVDGGYTDSCAVYVSKIPVTGVSLNKTSISLDIGEAMILKATVKPEDATNKSVVWSSSSSRIASVDSNGIVLGRSRGTVTITVKTRDGNYTDTCRVEVDDDDEDTDVTGVSLDRSSAKLEVGEMLALEADVRPDSATNKDVRWYSSDEDVATVDEDGIVTAEDEGKAVITVKTEDGGYTDTCTITVVDEDDDEDDEDEDDDEDRVYWMKLNKIIVFIKEGQTQKLVPIFIPGDVKNKDVTWGTSDDKVARVDEHGNVIGVSQGIAIITATTEDGDHSAKCIVLVTDKKGNGKGKAKGHWKN